MFLLPVFVRASFLAILSQTLDRSLQSTTILYPRLQWRVKCDGLLHQVSRSWMHVHESQKFGISSWYLNQVNTRTNVLGSLRIRITSFDTCRLGTLLKKIISTLEKIESAKFNSFKGQGWTFVIPAAQTWHTKKRCAKSAWENMQY